MPGGLAILVAVLFTPWAPQAPRASIPITEEIQSLIQSLPPGDPAIKKLTLRLADLYFEEKQTQRAIETYEHILKAHTPGGKLKAAVHFQLGRLYAEGPKAQSHFLLASKEPSLKGEAIFALAELHERANRWARARKLYQQAIQTCQSMDTCPYIRARLAWSHYREGNIPQARSLMKPNLFDPQGELNEGALRDYKLFTSRLSTDGISELAEFEQLSQKIPQDSSQKGPKENLIEQMAHHFFEAGNRAAGYLFMKRAYKLTGGLSLRLKLMEESLGLRDWAQLKDLAQGLGTAPRAPLEHKAPIERIIVELNALKGPQLQAPLREILSFHLASYPQDPLREAWARALVKTFSTDAQRAQALKKLIDEEQRLGMATLELAHRKARMSFLKNHPQEWIKEARALSLKSPSLEERQKYTYWQAQKLAQTQKWPQALPLLKSLSPPHSQGPWDMRALHLALDILSKQKQYDQMLSLLGPALSSPQELSPQDTQDLLTIKQETLFERAVSQGESQKALETFLNYCRKEILASRACPNAKALALKLQDQRALIELLERAQDHRALAQEYERSGLWARAAKLQEKLLLKPSPTTTNFLKVALLYEMGQHFEDRDRILKKLIKTPIPPKLAPTVYLTLYEAKLLQTPQALKLPWPQGLRRELIERLDYYGQLPAPMAPGPTWSQKGLLAATKLDQKQRQQGFYGKRSKRNFQKRVKLITKLRKKVRPYLEKATPPARALMASLLAQSYHGLTQEILATPLPQGIDQQLKAQATEGLAALAGPFAQLSAQYQALAHKQQALVEDLGHRDYLKELLALGPQEFPKAHLKKFFSPAPLVPPNNPQDIDLSPTEVFVAQLQNNPQNKAPLEGLKNFYHSQGLKRQARYFEERLKELSP